MGIICISGYTAWMNGVQRTMYKLILATDQGVTSKIRDCRTPVSDRRCVGPFRFRFITMVLRDFCRSGEMEKVWVMFWYLCTRVWYVCVCACVCMLCAHVCVVCAVG